VDFSSGCAQYNEMSYNKLDSLHAWQADVLEEWEKAAKLLLAKKADAPRAGGLLCFDVGLGKTRTMLELCKRVPMPTILIVKSTSLDQVEEEIIPYSDFVNTVKCHTWENLSSPPKNLSSNDKRPLLYLITKQGFTKSSGKGKDHDNGFTDMVKKIFVADQSYRLICDEIHEERDGKTNLRIRIKIFSENLLPHNRMIYLITATPIQRGIEDVVDLLQLVMGANNYVKLSACLELQTVQHYVQVVTNSEAAPQLQGVKRSLLPTHIDSTEVCVKYTGRQADMITNLQRGSANKNDLNMTSWSQMILLAPTAYEAHNDKASTKKKAKPQIAEGMQPTLERAERLRAKLQDMNSTVTHGEVVQLSKSIQDLSLTLSCVPTEDIRKQSYVPASSINKTSLLSEWPKIEALISILMTERRHCIIFCHHIAECQFVRDVLTTHLCGVARISMVTGEDKNRTQIFNEIKQHVENEEQRLLFAEDHPGSPPPNGQISVLVMSMVGKSALNLQFMSMVIFMSWDWDWTSHWQGIGRVARFGQREKTVKVYTIFTEHPREFRVREVNQEKQVIIDKFRNATPEERAEMVMDAIEEKKKAEEIAEASAVAQKRRKETKKTQKRRKLT